MRTGSHKGSFDVQHPSLKDQVTFMTVAEEEAKAAKRAARENGMGMAKQLILDLPREKQRRSRSRSFGSVVQGRRCSGKRRMSSKAFVLLVRKDALKLCYVGRIL